MRVRRVGWALLPTVVCAGCATGPSHADLAAFLKAHEHSVAAVESRIGASDTVSIHAPRIHEIDGREETVGPAGTISLRLVGEVKIAGLTTREIETKLEELLRPYYHDPRVHVRIVNQPQRVYYVLGEVVRRGAHPFTGHDTLMHALVAAGPNEIAWREKVKVIRPSPLENERRVLEIDVNKMVKDGDTRLNILLEPGDIVQVPPTPLGWLGKKIRELLYPATPAFDLYATPADFMYVQDDYENFGELTSQRSRFSSRGRAGRRR